MEQITTPTPTTDPVAVQMADAHVVLDEHGNPVAEEVEVFTIQTKEGTGEETQQTLVM